MKKLEQEKIIDGGGVDVVGGKDIPDHLIRTDVVNFTNYPDDDKSRHLLQLIGLHLWGLNDEEKDLIIDFVFRVVTKDKDCKQIC